MENAAIKKIRIVTALNHQQQMQTNQNKKRWYSCNIVQYTAMNTMLKPTPH